MSVYNKACLYTKFYQLQHGHLLHVKQLHSMHAHDNTLLNTHSFLHPVVRHRMVMIFLNLGLYRGWMRYCFDLIFLDISSIMISTASSSSCSSMIIPSIFSCCGV